MSLSAVFGLDRILRRIRQLELGVDPLTLPAATSVSGVDVALVLRQAAVAAGVGIEAATPLRDRDHRPGALVGGCRRQRGSRGNRPSARSFTHPWSRHAAPPHPLRPARPAGWQRLVDQYKAVLETPSPSVFTVSPLSN